MNVRNTIRIFFLAACCGTGGSILKADETADISFVTSSKYARPYNNIEVQNCRKTLLGPTGIFAYGPYGAGFYLNHYWAYKRDRNWFVVISMIPDSPAVGLIKKDDVITGANGKRFPQDEDARVHMGRAIIDSESKDGLLTLMVNRKGEDIEVEIQLKPIGGFSPTWPFNCPRTDRMVTDACRFLQEEQMPDGYIPADEADIGTSSGGLLFLGTGEPHYLENARLAAYWFADKFIDLEQKGERLGWGAWAGGYALLLMTEYYEMTGDRGILPGLEVAAKQVAHGQMQSGGWGHGFFNGFTAGYGEMNQCGITCYMGLVLAKECGVPVDETALAKARKYFGGFGPTVASQYGDHDLMIKGYGTHNGHIGQLATVFRLDGQTEFADAYALKVARAIDKIEGGHTGCMFNIIWSPIGASFAPAEDYRRGMDQFDWYYALCREPRGGFFCQPGGDNLQRTGGEYSTVGENMSTGGFGLALVAPRRHLRILGAPKSVFVVDLPPALKSARKLHQENKWTQCIAAVDAFLADAGTPKSPETLRLANELRDKARYVRTSVTSTFSHIEDMFAVDNPNLNLPAYEIKHMLRPLQDLLGKEDARLKAIEERLPYEDAGVFMQARRYYDACQSLKRQRMEVWFPYGQLARNNARWMVTKPRDDWGTVYDTKSAHAPPRFAALKEGERPPADWAARSFDDSKWPDTMPRGAKGVFSTGLMRIPFDLASTDCFGVRLVVDKKPTINIGAKVYLNGELVLKCNSQLFYQAEFLPSTIELLKPGRNVIAIEMPYKDNSGYRIPRMRIQIKGLREEHAFAWTPVPGRDADIMTLTSRRLMPHPYYTPKQDHRSVKELIAVFHDERSFMPELYNAMERFKIVVSPAERPDYLDDLLRSSAWGGRMIGLMLVGEGVNEPEKGKRMSKEEFEALKTTFRKLRPTYDPFRSRVAALLNDPRLLVRVMAARAIGGYGNAAKASIPTLIKLLADTENQHWWVREAAFLSLNKMSLDPATKRKIMLIAFQDPSASVRRHPLTMTARIKDPEKREQAMNEYKKAMIDQVFDAPLGMWTSGTRKSVALKLKALGKDTLRPSIPRFLTGLNDETGPRLEGCSDLLAWFGDEVIDEIEKRAGDKNPTLRVNALNVLTRMATEESASDQLVKRVVNQLKAAEKAEETSVSRAATEGLKKITANSAKKG